MRCFLLIVASILIIGCSDAAKLQRSVDSSSFERFTLGNVQRKVYVGMSQADVAEALGSPNIATTDSQNKETWIYDKMAQSVVQSGDSSKVWFIIGTYNKNSGAENRTQKTLTVIIKFDADRKVESVRYHSSQF